MSRFKTSIVFKQKFTKEMLTEFEETFAMVCDDEGLMPIEKLPLTLRALGLEVAESHYEDLLDRKSSSIEFDVFLSVVNVCTEHANFMQAELLVREGVIFNDILMCAISRNHSAYLTKIKTDLWMPVN